MQPAAEHEPRIQLGAGRNAVVAAEVEQHPPITDARCYLLARRWRRWTNVRIRSGAALVLGENEPACCRIERVVPRIDVRPRDGEVKPSSIDDRIRARAGRVAEDREHPARAPRLPGLVAPVDAEAAARAHGKRRARLAAMSSEVIAEVAMAEQRRETRVGLAELP